VPETQCSNPLPTMSPPPERCPEPEGHPPVAGSCTPTPDLPEGWRLDPAERDHRPDIGVWWVILPDGRRTAWNTHGQNICTACEAEPGRIEECELCSGRGVFDQIPYCDRPWDEVVPGLWVGGHHCQFAGAPDGNCFPGETFDMVVSLHRHRAQSPEEEAFDPPPHIRHYRHKMADADLDPSHHGMLDVLAERIVAALERGEKVLVRCQAGINRGPFVAALAMLRMGWTPEAAIAKMREVRSPYVLFNTSFTDHLHQRYVPYGS
jgi:hypothetical protein